MSELDDILNFIQLQPDVGTAGQPTADQFETIAKAGYEAVINLALPSSDNALANEGALVTEQGMSYFHIPVDFEAPTAEEARRFIALMKMLDGKQVFVHCAMNLRVSAFMYVFLKHERGLDDAAARSSMFEWWEPRLSDAWREFLDLSREDVS